MARTLRAAYHLWVMLAVLGSCRLLSAATGTGHLTDSAAYPVLVSLLLAVGLYGSTSGIGLAEARGDLRTLLLAVTVGVLAKAALIMPVLWLAVGEPAYLILAVAVAQIDPLSVAALRSRSRMSERGKAVLSVWSSFDDPVTVLLTAYLAPVALSALDGGADASALPVTPDAYAWTMLGNVALVVVAALSWSVLRPRRGAAVGSGWRGGTRTAVCLLVLAGVLAAATAYGLMLGVAVLGLFYRPPLLVPVLGRVLTTAYYLALVALGLLLVDGVEPGPGIALGAAAFAAQMVVGGLIARNLAPYDRVSLALGQQNGVTAIVLALSLQPAFPRTVAIVAPAVVTVNVLHFVANELWNRREHGCRTVLFHPHVRPGSGPPALPLVPLAGIVGDQVPRLASEDLTDPRQGREADGLGSPVLEHGQIDDGDSHLLRQFGEGHAALRQEPVQVNPDRVQFVFGHQMVSSGSASDGPFEILPHADALAHDLPHDHRGETGEDEGLGSGDRRFRTHDRRHARDEPGVRPADDEPGDGRAHGDQPAEGGEAARHGVGERPLLEDGVEQPREEQ